MYIEKASLQDLQEILELQYIAYQSEAKLLKNWDIPPLKQTLSEVQEEYRKGIILKLIDEKNTIVGSVRGYLENHTVFIGKLMVHPEKQRQGLGKKLLLAMEKEYPNERYELFTSTMSKRNIEFYEKLGYRIFEEKKITEELVFVYLEKSCRNIREVDEMNYKESIEKTKQGFEASFQADAFYNKQTKDEKHLELILNFLKVQPGMKILDLGTGTGYLAFPLAKKYPKTDVTGLDIVEKALDENRNRAENEGITNLQFVAYNGMEFPFEDHTFDLVVTRYALHHFPAIHDTFREISRVLKENGALFLSDPAPNDDDTERFVDAYMQMKKDGHIKFYTKKEWKEIGALAGLSYVDGFETEIRFPKKKETALEFDDIVRKFDAEVIKGYGVEVIGDEIWITEKVNNLLLKNRLD